MRVADRAADAVAVRRDIGVRRKVVPMLATAKTAVDRRRQRVDPEQAHVAVEVVPVLLTPAQDMVAAAQFGICACEVLAVVYPAALLVRHHHVEEVHVFGALREARVGRSERVLATVVQVYVDIAAEPAIRGHMRPAPETHRRLSLAVGGDRDFHVRGFILDAANDANACLAADSRLERRVSVEPRVSVDIDANRRADRPCRSDGVAEIHARCDRLPRRVIDDADSQHARGLAVNRYVERRRRAVGDDKHGQ